MWKLKKTGFVQLEERDGAGGHHHDHAAASGHQAHDHGTQVNINPMTKILLDNIQEYKDFTVG